jgi:hypothetical protein
MPKLADVSPPQTLPRWAKPAPEPRRPPPPPPDRSKLDAADRLIAGRLTLDAKTAAPAVTGWATFLGHGAPMRRSSFIRYGEFTATPP